jgi:hypothetical protein
MQSFSASKGDGIADLERRLVLWMKPTVNAKGAEEDTNAALDNEADIANTEPASLNKN